MSFQEEEQGKSDSSENQEENAVIEINAEANDSPESGATDAAGCDESRGNNKEENVVNLNKKEDEEQKVCGDFFFTFLFVTLLCSERMICIVIIFTCTMKFRLASPSVVKIKQIKAALENSILPEVECCLW